MSKYWNTEKLNKYLSRIDGAIVQGRYNLALKLTDRLLKQYYRSFLTGKIAPTGNYDNVRVMSILICRYLKRHFRQYQIPYSERRIFLIALISNVLFIYSLNLSDTSEEQILDEATAKYVRQNVSTIIEYLMRYF